MSPRLRHMSGTDVVAIFLSFGFTVHSQKGSHVKMRRVAVNGQKQTMTIPSHGELDTGTLRAIVRQASRYVPESELRRYFYTD